MQWHCPVPSAVVRESIVFLADVIAFVMHLFTYLPAADVGMCRRFGILLISKRHSTDD